MTIIQVFDPALCCSSGVCGTDVDQALVTFSADVEWARHNGAKIERFNLAQQPVAFAEDLLAKAVLQESGEKGLPLILADGQQVLAGRYPSRDELSQWMNVKTEQHTVTVRAPLAQMASCCGSNASSAESAKGGCC